MEQKLAWIFDKPQFRSWVHEADRFLAEEARRPLEKQLQSRRIGDVLLRGYLKPTQAHLFPARNYFVVTLSASGPLEELARSLGHEMGHTFHYSLANDTLVSLYLGASWSRDSEVEKFCDEFMCRWLRVADMQRACEFLSQLFPERLGEYERLLRKEQCNDPRQLLLPLQPAHF